MATKTIPRNMRAVAKEAKDWLTPPEIAEQYGVGERFVRAAIERLEVEAIKLDRIRVNPESWEAFLASRYTPGFTNHRTD